MSRVSHGARLERLKRQLRGDPEFRVQMAPQLFELCAGRPLSAAELAELATLDLAAQWTRLQSMRVPSEGPEAVVPRRARTSEPGR
jgi:hypothetical protein